MSGVGQIGRGSFIFRENNVFPVSPSVPVENYVRFDSRFIADIWLGDF